MAGFAGMAGTMTLKPCMECGELSDESRCDDHSLKSRGEKAPSNERGYDHAWRKLSEKARKLQPFCSDCGATNDLQTDHSPEAWARKSSGKRIRLCDVDVVCGPCNRKRGAARGKLACSGGYPRLGRTTTRGMDPNSRLHTGKIGNLT